MRLEVPCDANAASTVRRALSEVPDVRGVLEDAMVVASELVNNAVLHSGCTPNHRLEVGVQKLGERFLISVLDAGLSGDRAEVRPPDLEAPGGLGLWIVEQLARRWGTERDRGYCVWAELAADPAARL